MADTHLGFRQYGLSERENDFYLAFEDTVRKIIQERPDFVIHSGDLFDFHRPQPKALWVAKRCFSKLHEKGIPVYAVTGNHDMLLRKGNMPPHILYDNLNVRIISDDEPFIVHKGVFIGGSQYVPKYQFDKLKETLSILSSKAKKFHKKVLILHQGIEKYLPFDFELKLSDIPKNFNYYALGHIHSRISENFGEGIIAYPGSTELWSVNELADLKKKGKGFNLVDLDPEIPYIHPIDVELNRDIIKEQVSPDSIEARIEKIKENISKSRSKPLLYIDIDDRGYDRKDLHNKLQMSFRDIALSLRISFSKKTKPEEGKKLGKSFDIEKMIYSILTDKKEARLAELLFKSLSVGDEEEAIKIAKNYYGGLG